MKKILLTILLLTALYAIFPQNFSVAQTFSGYLLIRIIEPGETINPERLFLADVAGRSLSELLIEGKSIAAPWFGWSPDGQTLAYLAPARRGINYELWLGNANGTNLRTPFLTDGQQTPVAAAWNPVYNIIATGTVSQETRDGIFLVNANNDNIILLAEEKLPQNPILDWSRNAYFIAYSTVDNALKIINTADRAVVTLKNSDATIPALPPFFATGWTINDGHYFWTDERYQALYPDLPGIDPFQSQMFPDGSALLQFDGISFQKISPDTGTVVEEITISEDLFVEDYGIAADNAIFFNALQTDSAGNNFMQCYRIHQNNIPERVSQAWTHTRCQVLSGGTHIAMMATMQPLSWERLPENLAYSLYILPVDLSRLHKITENYAGFEIAPLGFSASHGQAVFQEGQEIVVYNLQGEKIVLAALQDLDIKNAVYTFRWQP